MLEIQCFLQIPGGAASFQDEEIRESVRPRDQMDPLPSGLTICLPGRGPARLVGIPLLEIILSGLGVSDFLVPGP